MNSHTNPLPRYIPWLPVFRKIDRFLTFAHTLYLLYSTHCDAHIIFMFSRQYHINCLSIQNTCNYMCSKFMHIFLIFGRLYHIKSETDMHILYFLVLAACTTLIAKFLSTLLHLAGFVLMRFAEIL